jgi:hypothetical protein
MAVIVQIPITNTRKHEKCEELHERPVHGSMTPDASRARGNCSSLPVASLALQVLRVFRAFVIHLTAIR